MEVAILDCRYYFTADGWKHSPLKDNKAALAFPCWLRQGESACSVRDPGSVPGSGRSPGEGNGYPLQCVLAWRIP